MLALPPLSLYIHIPWCVRKCPYCDFNSHRAPAALPEADYVQALLRDLALDAPLTRSRPVTTVFIGGGTPSLFSAAALHTLLQGVRQTVELAPGAEITLEANPGTVEATRLAGYRAAGVNRLSLGVQSFSDRLLHTLGRIHDGEQAREAVAIARSAGFDNLNLDLMHGLPEQTQEQALADLELGLALEPEHLSWYQLTLEPNTEFHRRPPLLPDDDTVHAMQSAGQQMLAQAGLTRYEVSAYARPQRQSRHNLNYWQFGDYLGIGAGAHGKLTDPDTGVIYRLRKYRQPEHYLQQDLNYTAQRATIDPAELPLEFMLNALRLTGGFSRQLFESRTGLAFDAIAKQIEYLVGAGLLTGGDEHIAPTPRGQLFVNNLLEEFL
ncbi:MAG: hypothetical protein RLZZ385_2629 [Pseudomonadota bacterium]|jgi:oxygen-independent coproporphyrinogen-3 oxidase